MISGDDATAHAHSTPGFSSAREMDSFFRKLNHIDSIPEAGDTREGIEQFLLESKQDRKRRRTAEKDAQPNYKPAAKRRRGDEGLHRSSPPPRGGLNDPQGSAMRDVILNVARTGRPNTPRHATRLEAVPSIVVTATTLSKPSLPKLRAVSEMSSLKPGTTSRITLPAAVKTTSERLLGSPAFHTGSKQLSVPAHARTVATTAASRSEETAKSTTTSTKSSAKPEKSKRRSSNAPKDTENFELPLAEYATWIQQNYNPSVHGQPFEFKALQGKTAFLAVSDVAKHKVERQRLIALRRLGLNVASTYDPDIVHFVVTTQNALDTRSLTKSMGVSKVTEVPPHIRIVLWDWIIECQNKETDELPRNSGFELYGDRHDPKQPRAPRKVAEPAKPLKLIKKRKRTQPDSDSTEAEREAADESRKRRRSSASVAPPAPPIVDPLKDLYDEAAVELVEEHDSSFAFDPHTESDDVSSDEKKPVNLEKVNKGFACLAEPRDETEESPNQYLIDKLKELKDIYSNKQGEVDHFKVFNLNKVIGDLSRLKTKITTRNEALMLNGSGAKTADKIMEIVQTGQLQRIQIENTEEYRTCRLFAGIFDVGTKRAHKWYMQGLRTLEDVEARKEEIGLTVRQAIGLKYYHDLQERMPRTEASAIFEKIRETAMGIDGNINLFIMGSYRRGSETCGDIDMLLTRDPTDGITHAGVLPQLLDKLHRQGILTEDLSLPDDPDALEAKYMGLCHLGPGSKMRRIDILTIPYEQKGAALIYFTGDDLFNRSIRLLARKKGYSLNQRGLYSGVVRDPTGKGKLAKGAIIASKTEQEIFDVLGVPFRKPEDRRRA